MRFLLIILLCPLLALAQDFEFEQEWDSIQLGVDSLSLDVPWTGGYARSSPDFCDIDGDGDMDLFIGSSSGEIAFFQNTGSITNEYFNMEDETFHDISVDDLMGYSKPLFWDMDADGDFDIFVGSGRSLVRVYRNIGNQYIPEFEVWEDTLKDINGDWFYCDRPQLVDIDNDGDKDLFCGRYTGTVDYYRNDGDSANYAFRLVEIGVQGIDVGISSAPEMVDIDADGDYDLFVGNKYGKIWYYHNNGSPELYDFVLDTNNWLGIDVADYSSPEFCDINGDGDYDLFIGKENDLTFSIPGTLHYWENIGDPQNPDFIEVAQSYLTFDAGRSTRVDLCDIDNDQDLDIFFVTNYYLGWMENTGSPSVPAYSLQTYDLLGSLPVPAIDLGDFNGDNVADLVIADEYGGDFIFYENVSTPSQLAFQETGYMYTDYTISEINLVDIDGDGDNDLLFGAWTAYPQGLAFVYYENIGSPEHPEFSFVTENYQDIASLWISMIIPRMVDVDLDADYDLLLLEPNTGLWWFFENVGTPQQAQLDSTTNDFLGLGSDIEIGFYVDGGDIDYDGDVDIFGGTGYGGIFFFRNVTGQNEVGPKRPYVPYPKLDFIIGPNPANPVTWISFSLPAPQEATLAVYNILGAKVTTLASGLQMPGTHNYIWNASQYSSGVYIIMLEAGEWSEGGKVVVIK